MVRRGEAASFVARIWLESGPNGDPHWRGHLQHVQSGRSGFFDDLGALRSLVEGISGIAGPALGAGSRRAGHVAAGAGRATSRASGKPRKKRSD